MILTCCRVFQQRCLPLGPRPCDSCGKQYHDAATQEQHLNVIHKSIYICHCLICNQAFPNRAYNVHLRSHADQPVQCFMCAKTFPSEEKMLQHRPQCDKNAPDTPCAWCGKRFKELGNLKKHVDSIHLRYIIFRCTCGTQFFWKMSFRRHVATCGLIN